MATLYQRNNNLTLSLRVLILSDQPSTLGSHCSISIGKRCPIYFTIICIHNKVLIALNKLAFRPISFKLSASEWLELFFGNAQPRLLILSPLPSSSFGYSMRAVWVLGCELSMWLCGTRSLEAPSINCQIFFCIQLTIFLHPSLKSDW